ncbi:MAG: PEP-CTERM sorting domain-containing protein [Fimbriimonadaceae bacterium]|nr:PEP-CTERM sorting domain-containing protein [Fimbriimonadaceae bacterium]
MKKLLLCVIVGVSASAHATLIGYWNFNNQDFTRNDGLAAAGAQVTTTVDNISWFSGSTLNALNGDIAGVAFCPVGNVQNGRTMTVSFSSAAMSFSDIVVSYDTRGTSTGFANNSWSYSTDGVNFNTLAGSTYDQRDTVFVTRSFAFTPLASEQNVWLRLTFDGATGASGNNRIDNLQVNATATPVPEPASMLALAVGLGGALRLRRRNQSNRK